MADQLKKEHGVMVVMTTQLEFVAHTPGIDGGKPENKFCAALQFQGGGVIVPAAWRKAKAENQRGGVIRELLKQAIEKLPPEIVAAMGDCGEKAYEGEEPSRLVRPNMQEAMAARGMQGRITKIKPS